MSDVANQLKVKYGLVTDPDDVRIASWVSQTEASLRQGVDPETAGRTAARAVFPDFDRMLYRSQADTIMALLAAAKAKTSGRG